MKKFKRPHRRKIEPQPNTMKLGLMYDGPGKGQRFAFQPGAKHFFHVTPSDPVYKVAVYNITDRQTMLSEHIAFFSHGVKR